ncbi:Hypothetical protein SRAE_1000288800 [Strongyloides ratti]|uniref:Uncharacterized protein n=1 Tax=Strongyloides ratti TaxID=34506 RepID=A0A090LAS8_STRRB|nr:Hypothetical protein SRAE_1000288800 [Strongyloides ratti]CEF64635.1 Hypothetical protein SRAE_1000288800 [Strongyloides ratti]
MPKLHTNIEYFTKGGRKYKNSYENLNSPQKSSYIPRDRNRRCKSLTFFTRLGMKTPNIKHAFSKEDIDNYSPSRYILCNDSNNIKNTSDEVFYYSSFPSIIECNKSKHFNYDKLDKYIESNKNFKLPPLNSLYLNDNREKKRGINKISLYKNYILPIEKIDSKKINREIDDELKKRKNLQNDSKFYSCEEENLINKNILTKEKKRIHKLDTQIDEILYIIDRNNNEKKIQPPTSKFYCPKKKYKFSLNRLIQRYNK